MSERSLNIVNGIMRQRYDKYAAMFIVAADGSGHYTDIQSAINALPSSGGLIYMKEGTYVINSTISIIGHVNVSLIGAGDATVIYVANGANVSAIRFHLAHHVYLANFKIDGNKINQTTSFLCGVIMTQGGDFCLIENLHIANVNGYGMYLPFSSIYSQIVNNNVQNCNNVGIYTGWFQSVICGNICCYNMDDGIRALNSQALVIVGNCCNDNSKNGIRLASSFQNIVSNNSCLNNVEYGVRETDTANYNIITSNCLRNNALGGLLTVGANTEIGHNIT